MTGAELYARGAATLLASWEAHARGTRGAALRRLPGVAAAVFPHEPESGVYNNALLNRDLSAGERASAIDAMEAAYATAGVERFAAWTHERDAPMHAALTQRGYVLEETTRAMGMALDDLRVARPELDLGTPDWSIHRRLLDLPSGLLARADRSGFRLAVARLDGEDVSVAVAFDWQGDCGIFDVGTVERERRRGLATALSALVLHDARARGCRTASLHATAEAEGVYAAAGFRDLGRIFEYAPER